MMLIMAGLGVWSWVSGRNNHMMIPPDLVRSARELPSIPKGSVCIVPVGDRSYFVNRGAEKNTIIDDVGAVVFAGKDKSTQECALLRPARPILIIDSNKALRQSLHEKHGVVICFCETEVLVFDFIRPQNYLYKR